MKSFLRYISLVMVILGAFLLVTLYPYGNSAFAVPFAITENKITDSKFLCEGTPVDVSLTMIMDSYGAETIGGELRKQIFGTCKWEYNIVPIYVGDETYYVGIKLSQEDFLKANSIIENTNQYHHGEDVVLEQTFEADGILLSMDEELYGYMKEWFAEMSWLSEDEASQYVLPLVIEPIDGGRVKMGIYVAVGLIAAGIIFFIVTLFFGLKYKKRLKEFRKCQGVIVSEYRGKRVAIPVKELADVDMAMWKGNEEKAKKILIKTYKATKEEADDIVKRWTLLTSTEAISEE